jgi:multidrug efflux pump subunit AcrB
MVFFFLGDLRSALIVVLTIPLALLGAVTCLSLTGQTLNLMTLGGLALAVGILVDEATVTVENIHRHQESGKPKRLAILEASLEISFPKLLILLCILMVFVPSFFMSGLPRAMFQPLAMAVGFAMIISFLLSQTFVPVISAWLLSNRLSQHNNGKTFPDAAKIPGTHCRLDGMETPDNDNIYFDSCRIVGESVCFNWNRNFSTGRQWSISIQAQIKTRNTYGAHGRCNQRSADAH